MSVSYLASLKTTRMTAVITAIDVNASAGYMEICTAAYATVLATITFQKPSFTVSGAVITMAGSPISGTAVANGTAAVARIKDGGTTNVVVNSLTVGTSASDIILNNTTIATGQTVSLTGVNTITHSA